MSLGTAAYDWAAAGLFVSTVLPLPGIILGSALGLAIASRGKLGHRMFLHMPSDKSSRRLVQGGVGVAIVGIPTAMSLEKKIEEVSLTGGKEARLKVQSIENTQKLVTAITLLSLQLAGGAIGYKYAWQVARRLKWTA